MDNKNNLIIEAGHVTEVYGPVQALKNHLLKRRGEFILITHPFSYSKLEGTVAEVFLDGVSRETISGHKRGGNQPVQWLKDIYFNVKFGLSLKKKADLFIGIDNLNAMTGIFLKWIGRVDRTVYYIIDHTPRRFKNPVLNFFYEAIDRFACERSDFIWSLSERIAEAKEKKYRIKKGMNMVVPVGVELGKVDKFTEAEKVSKKTMVLMSMLDETKGIQLLIDCMRDISARAAGAQLLIIGSGPYEQNLKDQAKSLGLGESVKFLGLMDHDTLFKFIPHERVGLAPYSDDANNYSYYADPTKPKEYLACGLPVVITGVPWIAAEIEKRPMGVVCKYEKESLINACVKILNDDVFYRLCLKNSVEFASHIGWDSIYDDIFAKMQR
jgi:glycosyltransferase involved in cell wall biosynthesis